jgi:predicted dehydrogenase
MDVGIVGCGVIAAHHLNCLLKRRDVRQILLADTNRARARAVASRFGLKGVHPDLESMVAAQPLDVVHVLTPPMSHAELAIRAMELGAHVLVEKPMAVTERQAEAMLSASRRHAVMLAVGHNLLCDPLVRRAQQIVESGRLGRIVHVDCTHVFDLERIGLDHRNNGSGGHWSLALPGGPMMDHVPHPASLLLQFLGRPERISVVAKNRGLLPGTLPDELRVLVDADDITGTLSVSFGIRPDALSLHIYGTEMSLHANISNMAMVVSRNRRGNMKLLRAVDNVSQAWQLLWETAAGVCKLATKRAGPPGDVGPLITGFYDSIENGQSPGRRPDEQPSGECERQPFSAEFGREVARFLDMVQAQME